MYKTLVGVILVCFVIAGFLILSGGEKNVPMPVVQPGTSMEEPAMEDEGVVTPILEVDPRTEMMIESEEVTIYPMPMPPVLIDETEVDPMPRPQGKIDVRVACESALMYTTFTDGAAAVAYVEECIEGKHPEVIERFITDMGVDGATI